MSATLATTLERLSAARTALVLDHPFFGALALRLTPIESAGQTRTMATDGRSLFYNPKFVAEQSDQELIGVYAHEVMHPAMQHHTRRESRDPKRWNEAADYAINPILVEAGFILPAGGLNDPAYAGLTAEQIYDQLQQKQQQEPSGGDQPGAGNELADLPGAILDAPEPAQDGADWQVAVTQAAQAAKMMGRLPGSMARAVQQMMKPRVDWRALLRRFVQNQASADYSWRRPNPRYLAGGIYLPELRSESLPAIVVAVDTSGSIDQATLAAFRAEISSIVDECQPEATHVIYCDARVQRMDSFARGEPIQMHAQGGGGTDFCPVFEHVEAEQIVPACLIYLTDGYGSYPQRASEYPTLWAMTTDCVAPWGETVKIDSTGDAS